MKSNLRLVLVVVAIVVTACSGSDEPAKPEGGAEASATAGASRRGGTEPAPAIDSTNLTISYVDEDGNPFTYTRLDGAESFRWDHDFALLPVDGDPVACQRRAGPATGAEGDGWECITYAQGSTMAVAGLAPGLVRPLITEPLAWSGEPAAATVAGRPARCGQASPTAEALQAWSLHSGVGLSSESTIEQCVDGPSGLVVRTILTEPGDPTPPTVSLEAVELTEPATDSMAPPAPPLDATDLDIGDLPGPDPSCCDGS